MSYTLGGFSLLSVAIPHPALCATQRIPVYSPPPPDACRVRKLYKRPTQPGSYAWKQNKPQRHMQQNDLECHQNCVPHTPPTQPPDKSLRSSRGTIRDTAWYKQSYSRAIHTSNRHAGQKKGTPLRSKGPSKQGAGCTHMDMHTPTRCATQQLAANSKSLQRGYCSLQATRRLYGLLKPESTCREAAADSNISLVHAANMHSLRLRLPLVLHRVALPDLQLPALYLSNAFTGTPLPSPLHM